ncbi:MAG: cell division protein ZapE [Alphaproteobacteria bacterium]|nr:cell division protein ZapE [Alphaproteobacteria bacterium]
MKRGPRPRYNALVKKGALDIDPAQDEAVDRLQAIHLSLMEYGNGRRLLGQRKPMPQGLYLWGEVGRGKTLLMDLFFNNTSYALKRRVHFHEFMAETHERIAAWRAADDGEKRRHKAYSRKAPDDPITPVAYDIAREARLLCFDEFQINDIADAMILGRLFSALFDFGVVAVATSNRAPDELYKDGLNRQLFLPFIDLLKLRLDVFELRAEKDYRLAKLENAPVYYQPLGPAADAAMAKAWERMICDAHEQQETLQVKGRTLVIPRAARGAARFTFNDLCAKPLGASDYLAIIRRYGAIFIDHIPIMGADMRNEAKRFVALIDTIYDSRTKMICSADGEPHELYRVGDGAFEFERTASRLMEMRSTDYLSASRKDSTG